MLFLGNSSWLVDGGEAPVVVVGCAASVVAAGTVVGTKVVVLVPDGSTIASCLRWFNNG